MGNVLSSPAVQLAASIAVPLGGGMAIGIGLRNEVTSPWYKNLKKPSWNPPNWVFGPVWTTVYSLMGYASWRVWQAGGGALPLGLYASQLLLNFAWSPLFFGKKDLKAATLDITALLGLVAATTWEFAKVDGVAAACLAPYLAWGSFATCLTWWIWSHNAEEGKRAKHAAKDAASQAATKAHSAVSEATAAAATPFLRASGERQHSDVPLAAAEATARRVEGSAKPD